MNLSERFLDHAFTIAVPTEDGKPPEEIALRRSVSASYYALFHRISEDAARLIAPNVSIDTSRRIQRWFEHSEIKKICGRFLQEKLDQPLLGLLGETSSEALQSICRTFIKLQEARHAADYDQSYSINPEQTLTLWVAASKAIRDWQSIKETEEANVFILSLLLWKNWDKERG